MRQPHTDVSLPLFLLPFPSLKINKILKKKKKGEEGTVTKFRAVVPFLWGKCVREGHMGF